MENLSWQNFPFLKWATLLLWETESPWRSSELGTGRPAAISNWRIQPLIRISTNKNRPWKALPQNVHICLKKWTLQVSRLSACNPGPILLSVLFISVWDSEEGRCPTHWPCRSFPNEILNSEGQGKRPLAHPYELPILRPAGWGSAFARLVASWVLRNVQHDPGQNYGFS